MNLIFASGKLSLDKDYSVSYSTKTNFLVIDLIGNEHAKKVKDILDGR